MSDSPSTPLLVACLCAQWCGTCRDYQATFAQVARGFPGARFVWVDIEDQADLMDTVEVENFPTLLIAAGNTPLFFGPITPQAETLSRLVRAQADASSAGLALVEPELLALADRLRALARD